MTSYHTEFQDSTVKDITVAPISGVHTTIFLVV
jgi:hypothetical protein